MFVKPLVPLSLQVNGRPVALDVPPSTLLVDLLREQLALTGTHQGCDTAQCGACTVHMNGEALRSCVMPVSAAEGKNVTTIEGLAANGVLVTSTENAKKLGAKKMIHPVGYGEISNFKGAEPLADITVLQDKARILAVMKDGFFHRAPPVRSVRATRWTQ